MKRLLILLLLPLCSYTTKDMVVITIQTLNPDKQPIEARVQFLSADRSKIIYEAKKKGTCQVEIKKGDYSIRLIHCDTTYLDLKAYRNHAKIVFLDDDCFNNI